jgi:flagellar biosynthetic protein FlhB
LSVHIIFIEGIKLAAILAMPIIIVGLAATLAGNLAQGGLSLSTEALMPKPEKFNPVSNIKRVFGMDAIVNLVKSLLKLLFLGVVAYGVIQPMIEKAPNLINAPLATVGLTLGNTLYQLAFRYALVILALAVADYGYTVYKHEKSLKMTKQEIRDEFKQQEGDPMIKSQRRRVARALVQKRSLGQVPEASVVITNPTHFAVALRYNHDKDAAPMVVAKGADLIAKKIREIATENNIPLVENPPLARALYKVVEPNQMVPIEFFGAVAEVLAYVFSQKKDK